MGGAATGARKGVNAPLGCAALCLKLTSSRPHVTWAKGQQNLSQLSLMEFTNIYLFFQFSIPVRVMCSAA